MRPQHLPLPLNASLSLAWLVQVLIAVVIVQLMRRSKAMRQLACGRGDGNGGVLPAQCSTVSLTPECSLG
jgi:hypothetical protein